MIKTLEDKFRILKHLFQTAIIIDGELKFLQNDFTKEDLNDIVDALTEILNNKCLVIDSELITKDLLDTRQIYYDGYTDCHDFRYNLTMSSKYAVESRLYSSANDEEKAEIKKTVDNIVKNQFIKYLEDNYGPRYSFKK